MAEFNYRATYYFEKLTKEEQEKAVSILKTLDGLEIETARRMLKICEESLKTKAVVKMD